MGSNDKNGKRRVLTMYKTIFAIKQKINVLLLWNTRCGTEVTAQGEDGEQQEGGGGEGEADLLLLQLLQMQLYLQLQLLQLQLHPVRLLSLRIQD